RWGGLGCWLFLVGGWRLVGGRVINRSRRALFSVGGRRGRCIRRFGLAGFLGLASVRFLRPCRGRCGGRIVGLGRLVRLVRRRLLLQQRHIGERREDGGQPVGPRQL